MRELLSNCEIQIQRAKLKTALNLDLSLSILFPFPFPFLLALFSPLARFQILALSGERFMFEARVGAKLDPRTSA